MKSYLNYVKLVCCRFCINIYYKKATQKKENTFIDKTKLKLDIPQHLMDDLLKDIESSFNVPKIRADFEKWKKERNIKSKELLEQQDGENKN